MYGGISLIIDGINIDRNTPIVRDYDVHNSENRVNIMLFFGQSNSIGITTTTETVAPNILMPVEKTHGYPSAITFQQFTNNKVCKSDFTDRMLINTATKFASKYNDTTPLYIIQIAREGIGIDVNPVSAAHWAMDRVDSDQTALYPQTIHYLKTIMLQLQAEGKEPYVIGLDWNQWEAENQLNTSAQYTATYKKFFDSLTGVIPNTDYRLFLCKPASYTYFNHVDKMRVAFADLKTIRPNTMIYDPLTYTATPFRDGILVHYKEVVHDYFADYIIANYQR